MQKTRKELTSFYIQRVKVKAARRRGSSRPELSEREAAPYFSTWKWRLTIPVMLMVLVMVRQLEKRTLLHSLYRLLLFLSLLPPLL